MAITRTTSDFLGVSRAARQSMELLRFLGTVSDANMRLLLSSLPFMAGIPVDRVMEGFRWYASVRRDGFGATLRYTYVEQAPITLTVPHPADTVMTYDNVILHYDNTTSGTVQWTGSLPQTVQWSGGPQYVSHYSTTPPSLGNSYMPPPTIT